jgi:hypothetical protein
VSASVGRAGCASVWERAEGVAKKIPAAITRTREVKLFFGKVLTGGMEFEHITAFKKTWIRYFATPHFSSLKNYASKSGWLC